MIEPHSLVVGVLLGTAVGMVVHTVAAVIENLTRGWRK